MPLDHFEEQRNDKPQPSYRFPLFFTLLAGGIAILIVAITSYFRDPSRFADFLGWENSDNARSLVVFLLIVAGISAIIAIVLWIIYLARINPLPYPQKVKGNLLCGICLAALVIGGVTFTFYVINL